MYVRFNVSYDLRLTLVSACTILEDECLEQLGTNILRTISERVTVCRITILTISGAISTAADEP